MLRFVMDCALIRPIDDQTRAWFAAGLQRGWASPSAGYHEGKTAAALLDQAAADLAGLAGGGSAWFAGDPVLSVHTAVADLAASGRFRSVCTSAVDSEVVAEGTRSAARVTGLTHQVVGVDRHGRIDVAELPANSILVTNAGNQEIGVRQSDLGPWRQESHSAVVLDAACSFGWSPPASTWDTLLLDPRAWGAPAGAWTAVTAAPTTRRGFSDVPAAVTAGLAAQRWLSEASQAAQVARAQVARIRSRVLAEITDVEVHGGLPDDLPHILSISVLYVDAQALQGELDKAGFAVGSGSACASRSGQPSHVLAAIGGLTSGNVRLGLPPGLPDEAVDGFVDALVPAVGRLREQVGL